MPKIISAKEMQLGDTVRPVFVDGVGPWDTAIVIQIKDGDITLSGPYGTCADFSYTGGVICYICNEEYKIGVNYQGKYELLYRKTLK